MKPGVAFSTQSYAPMLEEFCQAGGYGAGRVDSRLFPDGERYQRILDSVDGRDAIILGGTISDQDTLEIYDMAGAVADAGARSLTLVLPYYGYSTMERATAPREAVTAKSRARLLSSLTSAPFGNRVVLFDLHSDGIPYYFEGQTRALHCSGQPVIAEVARAIGGDDFVIACTDAGRAKWVQSLANTLGVTASFVFKRRLAPDRTEVIAVSAHVEHRRVIIYDDMIRTGGTLLGAARAYLDAGAASVAAIATHGVFAGEADLELVESGLFTHIVCTDSHPRARAAAGGILSVRPVSGLLAAFLAEHSIPA